MTRSFKRVLEEQRFYLPEELADEWGVSSEVIRQVFRDEPGVLKFVIPLSVAMRVHQRLLSGRKGTR